MIGDDFLGIGHVLGTKRQTMHFGHRVGTEMSVQWYVQLSPCGDVILKSIFELLRVSKDCSWRILVLYLCSNICYPSKVRSLHPRFQLKDIMHSKQSIEK